MLSFGDPESEATMLLDMLSAQERSGKRCPQGIWQDMCLADQECYLVFLRMALNYSSHNPDDVSEEAMTFLFERYAALFKHLVNTNSRLRTAILTKKHSFLFANDTSVVQYFRSLVDKKV